jgi:hypothetical protein
MKMRIRALKDGSSVCGGGRRLLADAVGCFVLLLLFGLLAVASQSIYL